MSEGVWRAVVEAHERELMMQQERVPGRPVGVTPAELMARQSRLVQAIAEVQSRMEIRRSIEAYARRVEAQRAAVLLSNRLWNQARALLVAAGAEPPR